jgi:hypothetical protein
MFFIQSKGSMDLQKVTGPSEKELKETFHLPLHMACIKFGLQKEELNKICRGYGIKRWPFSHRKRTDKQPENGFIEFQCQTNFQIQGAKEPSKKKRSHQEPLSEAPQPKVVCLDSKDIPNIQRINIQNLCQ